MPKLKSKQSKEKTQKLKDIELQLNKLSRVRIANPKSYTNGSIYAESFREWIDYSKELKDPDKIRNALYYGFQPLYDSLVNNSDFSNRLRVVSALNSLTKIGVDYLTSYYEGEPRTKMFADGVKTIGDVLSEYEGIYRKKTQKR